MLIVFVCECIPSLVVTSQMMLTSLMGICQWAFSSLKLKALLSCLLQGWPWTRRNTGPWKHETHVTVVHTYNVILMFRVESGRCRKKYTSQLSSPFEFDWLLTDCSFVQKSMCGQFKLILDLRGLRKSHDGQKKFAGIFFQTTHVASATVYDQYSYATRQQIYSII